MSVRSPEEICESVLKTVKSSNLEFSIQETPFSAHITVRKKFSKTYQSSDSPHAEQNKDGEIKPSYEEELKDFQTENENLLETIKNLEAIQMTNVNNLKDTIDAQSQSLQMLEKELEASERKYEMLQRIRPGRDTVEWLGNSDEGLLHPSETFEKHLNSQFYFFDTL